MSISQPSPLSKQRSFRPRGLVKNRLTMSNTKLPGSLGKSGPTRSMSIGSLCKFASSSCLPYINPIVNEHKLLRKRPLKEKLLIIKILSNYGDQEMVEWGSIMPLDIDKHIVPMASNEVGKKQKTDRYENNRCDVKELPKTIVIQIDDNKGFEDVQYIRFLAPNSCGKSAIKDVEIFHMDDLIWKGQIDQYIGAVADLKKFSLTCVDTISSFHANKLLEDKKYPKFFDRFGIFALKYNNTIKITFLSTYSGSGTFTLSGISIFTFSDDQTRKRKISSDDILSIQYNNSDVENGIEMYFNMEQHNLDNLRNEDEFEEPKNKSILMTIHKKSSRGSLLAELENDNITDRHPPTTMPEIIIVLKRKLIIKEIRFDNLAPYDNNEFCTKHIKITIDNIPAFIGKLKSGKNNGKEINSYTTSIVLQDGNEIKSF